MNSPSSPMDRAAILYILFSETSVYNRLLEKDIKVSPFIGDQTNVSPVSDIAKPIEELIACCVILTRLDDINRLARLVTPGRCGKMQAQIGG